MNARWPFDWDIQNPLVMAASPEQILVAEEYVANTLRMLTLNRVGGTEITVMPSGSSCHHPMLEGAYSLNSYASWPGWVYPGALYPGVTLQGGRTVNCWCSASCGCSGLPGIRLVPPVGPISEIMIDGAVLPPEDYRVDDNYRLVRLDGGSWPVCAGDKFTVTYLNGFPVTLAGRHAGAVLGLEYLKALTGDKKCRLPSSVTSLTRQGVQMEFTTELFAGGRTGISEVDLYLAQFNPHGLRQAPAVYSVDYLRPIVQGRM